MALIALGSNLGDRDAHLSFARRGIAALPETALVAESAIEETEPLGGMEQPLYLNQVVAVETSLSARDLLTHLHSIESARGRVRDVRWGSRTLDLDLIYYDDEVSDDPLLTLPHPGLATREFWRREVAAVERQLKGR